MMVQLFMVIWLLLLGGEATAGPTPTLSPVCSDFLNGSLVETPCSQAVAYPIDCLTIMEAAMRAMDEFVPTRHPTYFIYDNTLLALRCDDTCTEREIIETAERRLATVKREQAAITQWNQAKRECWRKP